MTTWNQLPKADKLLRIEAAYEILFGDTKEDTGTEEFAVSQILSRITTGGEALERVATAIQIIRSEEQQAANDKQDAAIKAEWENK